MTAPDPIVEGAEFGPVVHRITQEGVSAYAEASGDFNPIHTDAEFAAGSRFGRRVAHGMMIAASVSELMAAAFGEDWAGAGRMKLRFRAPVFPGDRIETTGVVRSVEDAAAGSRRVRCAVRTVRCGDDGEQTAITGEASVVTGRGGDG